MNAIIYARYSSEHQNEKSIKDQIAECKEYAANNDFTIIDIYADRAKSGKTDRRPSFQQMIADAKLGKFKVILCWKFDRISRNIRDYYYYEKILYDMGVSIISINEKIESPEVAPVIKAVNLGMAESYNVTLAINVNRGMKNNALKCKSNGALPYGYVSDKDKNIILDEFAAGLVKEAFHMFNSGASYAGIARYFNECGSMTRFKHPWQGDKIKRLLKNDKYTGIYRFKDIEIEGGMPVIVNKEDFILAQENMKKYRKKHRIGCENYILLGKLRCVHCNKPMSITCGTSKSGKRYRYYKCSDMSIRKEVIEEFVIKHTIEDILTDENIEVIVGYVMDLQKEIQETSKLHNLKSELKETEKKIDRAVELLIDRESEAIRNKLEELEIKRNNLKTQVEIEEALNKPLTRGEVRNYLTRFRDMDITDKELAQELVDSLVMYVYLDDDSVWIQYKYAEKIKDTQALSLKELECSINSSLVNQWAFNSNYFLVKFPMAV